jgi:hypothetical protein
VFRGGSGAASGLNQHKQQGMCAVPQDALTIHKGKKKCTKLQTQWHVMHHVCDQRSTPR